MENSNKFQEGNGYRFTSDNQPSRLTTNKLAKRLEGLLGLKELELRQIYANDNEPLIVRDSAMRIVNGATIEVINLINSMKKCRESTQKRNIPKQN